MKPDVSFVCIADRPDFLRVLIACLRVQTSEKWELIVLDQTPYATCLPPVMEARALGETRIEWEAVPKVGDIGQSMKSAYSEFARGEYLCFPNDDAYYVPVFVDKLVWYGRAQNLDLVYCDWLFDRADNTVPYRHMPGRPKLGWIDIGGFIVRKTALMADGWGDRDEGGDGHLVERLASKHKHACLPDDRVYYVKN